MTLTPAHVLLSLLFLLALSSALTAQAFEDDPRNHIRTTDRRLIRLLHDGMRASDTFRRMVYRLRRSDVIVYLECGGSADRSVDGRLTFVSAAGGVRYVHIRVARLESADVQIALIGHELRHAVEIADAPGVIDGDSLAREYERIGFLNAHQIAGTSYDSAAAVEAGYRVLRDLTGRVGGQFPTTNHQLPTATY